MEQKNQLLLITLVILLFFILGTTQMVKRGDFIPQETPEKSEVEISDDLLLDSAEELRDELFPEGVPPEEVPTEPIITFDIEPATEGALFFEELLQIDGQNAYIAHPLTINKDNPPTLIVYSHGSITEISDSMENEYMTEFIRSYGEFFTQNNYIFAASNQHGANWGNPESVSDTNDLITYVKTQYYTADQINLLGFSMGGLPTWEYITQYPSDVGKVALLAPTSYYWNHPKDEIGVLHNIDIKIWHGDIDQSVPLSMSQDMINHASKYGKEIELVVLNGTDHWGVDLELKDEILEFFSDETP